MVTASFATSDQDLLLYIGSNWNGDNGSLSNRPDFKLGYYQPRADNVSSKKSGLQWWWIVIACCVVLFFVVSFVIIKCLPKSNEKIRDSISSTCTDFPDLLSDEEKPEIMVLRENLLEEDSMNGANMTNGPPFNDL